MAQPTIEISARILAWPVVRSLAARHGLRVQESWGFLTRDFRITGPEHALHGMLRDAQADPLFTDAVNDAISRSRQ
jgi:hypothetical protein